MSDFLHERLSVMFSTRTIIPKGWERSSNMPPSYLSVYGLSSWSYALLGLWLLYRYSSQPLFPGMMVEACLLFAQSMCSFGCDVFSFGRSSVWKPIDRLCASAFVTWQFTKLFWLDMALLEWVIWCTSLLIGITCFKRSIFSLKSAITASAKDDSLALDLSWYFWWHTLWHVSLPIGAALWSFARHSRLFPGAVAGVWIGTG